MSEDEKINWVLLNNGDLRIGVGVFSDGVSKAIVITGRTVVTAEQRASLEKSGFVKFASDGRTVFMKPRPVFEFSEIAEAFPAAAVGPVPQARTRFKLQGPSPFAPPKVAPAPPIPPARGTFLEGKEKAEDKALPPLPQHLQAPIEVLRAWSEATSDAEPIEWEESTPAAIEVTNAFQARYEPKVSLPASGAMIPTNLAAVTAECLDRIEAEVGDLVEWLCSRTGWSDKELSERLSAEQADGAALLLYNVDRGQAPILADQTGFGKGRELATVIVAMMREGRSVIFFTEKQNLFSDLWRDIEDVGGAALVGTPFVLNNDVKVTTSQGGKLVPAFEHDKADAKKEWVAAKALPEERKLVMATYSQINRKDSPKIDFLEAFASERNALVVRDESQNIIQDSNMGRAIERVVEAGSGVVNSSATYARTPDQVAAYRSSFPGGYAKANLSSILSAGGLPLQEALAMTLAADGILIRREHDLSDTKINLVYDEKNAEAHREYADQLAAVLRHVAKISRLVDEFVEEKTEENELLLETLEGKEKAEARERWTTAKFGARLSATVRQCLTIFALEETAEQCLSASQRGEKPVVVIENTMESVIDEVGVLGEEEAAQTDFFDEAAEEMAEEQRPLDLRDALRLLVHRSQVVNLRRGKAKAEKYQVELPEIEAEAAEALRLVEEFPALPLSPIDALQARLEAQGVRTGEISARNLRLVDGIPQRFNQMSRNETISAFNNGDLDAIILTRAGSTGLSLHASEKVADQRPRHMIEWQVPSNVIERVQMFGRVNRRGQIVPPFFTTVSTTLPSQVRNLDIQNRRIRELSAQVSASQDTATVIDTPDVVNQLGNEVAKRILDEQPELAEMMGFTLKVDDEKAKAELYFVNKLLQRLALLPVDEADQVYGRFLDAYRTDLQELESRGRHPRGSRELEGSWRVVSRTVFDPGDPQTTSAFGAPVTLTVIEADIDRKPIRGAEIKERVMAARERLGFQEVADGGIAKVLGVDLPGRRMELLNAVLPKRFRSVKEALSAKQSNAVQMTDAKLQKLSQVLASLEPGSTMSIPDEEDALKTGVVVDIAPPQGEGFEHPGKWQITYALPGDEAPRSLSAAAVLKEPRIRIYAPRQNLQKHNFYDFDKVEGGVVRDKRLILDGNLFVAVSLAAAAGYGQTVFFETEAGERRQGVLLPRRVHDNISVFKGMTMTPSVAFEVLREQNAKLQTEPKFASEGITLRRDGDHVVITQPGKKLLARPFASLKLEKLAGPFDGDWRGKEARVPIDRAWAVISRLCAEGYPLYYEGRFRGAALRAAPTPKREISATINGGNERQPVAGF